MNKLLLTTLALGAAVSSTSAKKTTQPNIIYILADDLGYGDLSCMGQDKFSTPNIDALAKQGMLFTQHYAGCTVSAPSRSTLVTGQHTGFTHIRGNKNAGKGEGQVAIPKDRYTIFNLFKDNGYTIGTFGKWGLGAPNSEGSPKNMGVDTFFGYNCQALAHDYYPPYLWENDKKFILKGNENNQETQYAAYLIHDRAKEFIKENKDKPFFMYYATTLPHAELRLPDEEIKPFENKFLPEKTFKGPTKARSGSYASQNRGHAAFAAMVTLLDRQVGEIVATLDELGIADNTLIIFTSDNGPHEEGGADPKYFNSNGPLKGIKRDMYEGGIRVPMIAKWPGKIKASSRTTHISAFWDFLPTASEILNTKVTAEINGISYLPTLMGKPKKQVQHEYLYWEFHERDGRQALRMGKWKAVIYDLAKGGELELYDLSTDIGEENNLADSHPELVKQIKEKLKTARCPNYVFPKLNNLL
ncbi:MAG: arylsulfatase [Rikenellaceae bacterium]